MAGPTTVTPPTITNPAAGATATTQGSGVPGSLYVPPAQQAQQANQAANPVTGQPSTTNENLIATGAVTQPQNAGQVAPYLQQVQQTALNAVEGATGPFTTPGAPVTAPAAPAGAPDSLSTQITPTGTAPVPPNLTQQYASLTQSMGVNAMKDELTQLQKQADTVQAQLGERTLNEQGKPVPVGVISGRTSQLQLQANQQLTNLNRTIAYKSTVMTNALDYINHVMTLTGQDYQNAETAYNTQFNQNIQLYNLKMDTQKLQDSEQQQAENSSRAVVQMYTDLIGKGQLNYSSLSPDQKLNLQKLSVTAGLPSDFLGSVKVSPGSQILNISNRTDPSGNKYLDMLVMDGNGGFKTQSQFLGKEALTTSKSGGTGSGSTTKTWSTAQYDAVVKAFAAQDSNGDKLLGADELQKLADKVNGMLGNKPDMAAQLLDSVMSAEGYQYWTPEAKPAQPGLGMVKTIVNKATDVFGHILGGGK